jgi:3-oxosteroid 1-dehydrogenase
VDERSRVLRDDGSVIAGLYAAGNVSASVMGRTYAGAGATIGPAMTGGYVAALELAALGPGATDPAAPGSAAKVAPGDLANSGGSA